MNVIATASEAVDHLLSNVFVVFHCLLNRLHADLGRGELVNILLGEATFLCIGPQCRLNFLRADLVLGRLV